MKDAIFWRPSLITYLMLLGLGLISFIWVATASLMHWALPALFTPIFLVITTALLALISLDYSVSRQAPKIQVIRKMAGTLALNRWTSVTLQFHHTFNRPVKIEVMDGLQGACVAQGAHFYVQLKPQQYTQQDYRLKPIERGLLTLQTCHIKMPTYLGLGELEYQRPVETAVKIFPDYAEVMKNTLNAVDNHHFQVGIKRKNRRGQGTHFHQLREYRQGDSLRQISWKATARRQQIISKDYQEERDQNLIILIDGGRRMCLRDDELTHFDHALNAALLVAYTALKQGDNVGFLSFGQSSRWLPPQRGREKITTLLHALYDLHPSHCATDYVTAAQALIKHQAKRSLVLLITNTRDEEAQELKMAMTLLSRHHLVVLANIREMEVDHMLTQPVTSYQQGLTYAGTLAYVQRRLKNHNELLQQGVLALDCKAKELPHALANVYWEIKKSGVL